MSHIVTTPQEISASTQACYDLICLNNKVISVVENDQGTYKKEYKPLVVVGPSGSGKGTLIKSLTSEHPDKFGFSCSYTTRPHREGEVHGTDYYFVTREKFVDMADRDLFIEWCEVHGNFYGTAKEQITKIMDQKKIPILDIDVQGAIKFQKVFPNSNFVAVLAPSSSVLEQRLVARGTENEE